MSVETSPSDDSGSYTISTGVRSAGVRDPNYVPVDETHLSTPKISNTVRNLGKVSCVVLMTRLVALL